MTALLIGFAFVLSVGALGFHLITDLPPPESEENLSTPPNYRPARWFFYVVAACCWFFALASTFASG